MSRIIAGSVAISREVHIDSEASSTTLVGVFDQIGVYSFPFILPSFSTFAVLFSDGPPPENFRFRMTVDFEGRELITKELGADFHESRACKIRLKLHGVPVDSEGFLRVAITSLEDESLVAEARLLVKKIDSPPTSE